MPADANHAIVLFDGTCLFCERAVTFIAQRDPDGYFKFGASQSVAAQHLLAKHQVDRQAARSIILIEDNQVYFRSTASLRIAGRLTFPWSLASVFLLVPARVRDAVYRVVAALRHRIAGESDACAVPPAPIRDRMI